MFTDRVDAGRQLAARLSRRFRGAGQEPGETLLLARDRPVVLGLPRGGVPVAAEVARALDGELDVLVVRKIGVPWQPELALGAVGEDGVQVVNEGIASACALSPGQLEELASRARAEVEARLRQLRAGRPAVPLAGRTAIVVDDGVATGATMRAAVDVVRAHGAARVVVAVPVAAADAVNALRDSVDELVVLLAPVDLGGVGLWYTDFTQTTDAEVASLLG
ncbi:MAG: putative phosphoribosyl transferase [Kribbellaceae bacterium]|nr:putative phosphoribosyl transferase [Kribbellaceae bacterium]